MNAIGTIFDRLGVESKWQGNWRVAAGRGAPDNLPEEMRSDIESFWCVEMALPFAELQTPVPSAGTTWRANFCIDGQRPLTFAPVREHYVEVERFATLRFLDEKAPSLRLTRLGGISFGQLAPKGALRNPTAAPLHVRVQALAEKQGTTVVERTGFDEISGAQERLDVTLTVPAGERQPLALAKEFESTEIDQLRIEISVSIPNGAATVLYANQGDLQILPPFRLLAESYPSNRYILCRMDTSGLAGSIDGVEARWRVAPAQGGGKETLVGVQSLVSRNQAQRVDLATLAAGEYELIVDLMRGAERLAGRTHRFTVAPDPEWLRNDIGKAEIVIPPFTPMEYGPRTVRMWGREMAWSDFSLMPSTLHSAGEVLLAEPMRLVLGIKGARHVLTLTEFTFHRRDPHRAEISLSGGDGMLRAEVAGWVEYDGLCWMDLKVVRRDGADLALDFCHLELPLRRRDGLYYHGVPDRSITGSVRDAVLEFPFQHYFWVGTCESGVGFVTESVKGMAFGEKKSAYRLLPGRDHVTWQVLFIDRPVTVKTLDYSFGLQATPVRPLAPDYNSWLSVNFERRSGSEYREFTRQVDITTIWGPYNQPKSEWWRDAFCDPMNIRSDRVKPMVEAAHADGVPILLYYAPMNFTDGACEDIELYANEWMLAPRTRWKSVEYVQSRACARSSFQDYLLFAFRKTVREAGLDGLYFDGAVTGACSNIHHGCGWMDEKGAVHPTVPVLADRAFNKRVAVMLYQEVQPRALKSSAAAGRPGWPGYYNWSHISGAVYPPALGFTTAYLSGEWFKGPIKAGKTYKDLLTLDTFRPRYLSAPWGVPNFFLPIMKDGDLGRTETESILAYMLTNGVPLYPRYFDKGIRRTLLNAMADFDTRRARYTPSWRKNPHLQFDAAGNPDLLLATWEREGRLLVVLGNIGGNYAKATLGLPKVAMNLIDIFPAPADVGARQMATDSAIVVPPDSFRLFRLEP